MDTPGPPDLPRLGLAEGGTDAVPGVRALAPAERPLAPLWRASQAIGSGVSVQNKRNQLCNQLFISQQVYNTVLGGSQASATVKKKRLIYRHKVKRSLICVSFKRQLLSHLLFSPPYPSQGDCCASVCWGASGIFSPCSSPGARARVAAWAGSSPAWQSTGGAWPPRSTSHRSLRHKDVRAFLLPATGFNTQDIAQIKMSWGHNRFF